MKLYHSNTSPFVRKVSVLLHETGLWDEVEKIPSKGTPLDSSNMPTDQNPLGKIPAFVNDADHALYDSTVICAYLDSLSGNKFHPAAPQLWRTLTLQATAGGILDAAILVVYENRVRPEEKQFPAWIDGQRAKINRALDTLEAEWAGHLTGPIDIGTIAVACMCGYFDFRPMFSDWRENRPNLVAFYDEFKTRPSMATTEPFE